MTLSADARAEMEQLVVNARDLIALLTTMSEGEATGVADAINNIRRYSDILITADQIDSTELALRGANLLTTVNKGLNDLSAVTAQSEITEKGFRLSSMASLVAKRLRSERDPTYN